MNSTSNTSPSGLAATLTAVGEFTYEAEAYSDIELELLEVSEIKFAEVKSSKKTCLIATEIEEKLALLLENFFEFETELNRISEGRRIWMRSSNNDFMIERLSLDRRIANLLTSCRLYLDQSDHAISRLFGKSSEELTEIKRFKNDLYDNHWGYRFMEFLRNHVQHAALPIHTLNYDQKGVDGDSLASKFIVTPCSSVAQLQESGSIKSAILKELNGKALKGKIDLRPVTREYVTCFLKLHKKIRETIKTKLEKERALYVASIGEFSKATTGESVRFPSLLKKDSNGDVVDRVQLVGEFLEYLDLITRRNPTKHDFQNSFTSGEAPRS